MMALTRLSSMRVRNSIAAARSSGPLFPAWRIIMNPGSALNVMRARGKDSRTSCIATLSYSAAISAMLMLMKWRPVKILLSAGVDEEDVDGPGSCVTPTVVGIDKNGFAGGPTGTTGPDDIVGIAAT